MKPKADKREKRGDPQSHADADQLLVILKSRFEKHANRHPGVDWDQVEPRLNASILARLTKLEETGGEPDIVLLDGPRNLAFVDCAIQSPSGRRSLCYDRAAWQERKEAKPASNVVDVAASMGVELLTESEYRALQSLETLDTTTSSWVATPPAIRAAGGALFCDRRYNHVFVYHNGAQSYYAARGFRAKLKL